MSQTRSGGENDQNVQRSTLPLQPVFSESGNVEPSSIVPFPSLSPDPQTSRRTTTFSLPPWPGVPARPRTSFLATRPSTFDTPSFSLAGPHGPIRTRDASGTFVDPEYATFAAPENWPKDEPLWGLAKPLPRVVRSGMRRRGTRCNNTGVIEGQGKGDAKATPQVWQTPEVDELHSRERQKIHDVASPQPSITQSSPEHEPSSQSYDRQASDMTYTRSLHNVHSATSRGGRGGSVLGPVEHELAIPPLIPEGHVYEPQEQVVSESPHNEEPEPGFLNKWSELRHKFREPLAEVLGTAIAMILGFCGSFAVTTSNDNTVNVQSGNWAWGFGIMIGIYISGGISGAHFNPAISIMLSVFRGFPWRRCGIYCVCQMLGALVAASIAFGLYREAILHLDSGQLVPGSTGVAFYTSPKTWVSPTTAFFNELVASAILGCAILALGDDTNAPPGAGMQALIVGLLVTALSMCFSYNSGACLNPVRDFAPRLVAFIAGYGRSVFTENNWWWIWGPFVADITGVLVGAFIYDAFVFVGGESPVNYPPRNRKRARMMLAARLSRKMGRRDSKVQRYEKKMEEATH